MAFKEVTDLSTDITIALGGTSRKTGKANPTQIQGYYLGNRQVKDKKKNSGFSYIYILQTPKGNVGVWGKTDLDRKMSSVPVGCMIRVTQNGMQETSNGEMYKFKVEVDQENKIETSLPPAQTAAPTSEAFEDVDYTDYATENEDDVDAVPAYVPPKAPAKAPSLNPLKAQSLLNRNKVS